MLYRRIWSPCIARFIRFLCLESCHGCLKVTSARNTDEHDASYTCSGLYPAFSRHRRVSFVICREQYEEAQAFRRNIYAWVCEAIFVNAPSQVWRRLHATGLRTSKSWGVQTALPDLAHFQVTRFSDFRNFKKVGWGCLRTGCCGEYWGLRGMK